MWIRFSACAAESEDSTSDCTRDSEWWAAFLGRSATWRGKHSPSRVWEKRLKKGGWMTHLSGAVISETFPQEHWLESIGYAPDTRVSPGVQRASGKGPTTPDTCGRPSSGLFGGIDLPACCLKTSQATSRWGCSTSCPTWKAAVTERRGAVTRRRLSAHRTDGNESSSLGWPTPTVAEGGKISCSPNFGQRGLSNHPEMVGEPEREKQAKTRFGEAGPHDPRNPKPTGNRPGQLNATWVETLMGFPVGWTDCAPSETQ